MHNGCVLNLFKFKNNKKRKIVGEKEVKSIGRVGRFCYKRSAKEMKNAKICGHLNSWQTLLSHRYLQGTDEKKNRKRQ